jgi:hypothetical protein
VVLYVISPLLPLATRQGIVGVIFKEAGQQTAVAQMLPVLLPPLTPTNTSTPTPAPTAIGVPTASADETRTLLAELIHREARAVLNRDMLEIGRIFSANAVLFDKRRNQQVSNVPNHYAAKFANVFFCEAKHDVIQITLINDSTAEGTSASSGRFRIITPGDTSTACPEHYENPPGSDEWHFQKSPDGTWRIDSFKFN